MTETIDMPENETQAPAPPTLPPLEERPLVTFAVFAYNQEDYIREAVEGAFSQTYEPLEIILSDDCSTDRTFEIMQEMAAAYKGPHEVRVRRNEVNLGLAGHLNKVLSVAKGSIISWAAGDDVALPHRTHTFVSTLRKQKNCIGVHSSVEEISIDGSFIKIRHHARGSKNITLRDVIFEGVMIASQSHAFRRIAWDYYGPLGHSVTNEGLPMAFRESSLGHIAYIEEPLTKYRIGCGISTQRPADLLSQKYEEPRKIATWSLTGYEQIMQDLKRYQYNNALNREVEKKIYYYKNIVEMHSGKGCFLPAIRNIVISPFDCRTISSLLRIAAPIWMYKVYKKQKHSCT